MRSAIEVQTHPFDVAQAIDWARQDGHQTGAVVSFIGYVRDFSERPDIQALFLEHYPGMTESSLQRITDAAAERWELQAVRIVHRIGRLEVGDPIVLVVVASAHRADAFAACEFLMDYLKVQAPFWKKEITQAGEHWVEERQSDVERVKAWTLSGNLSD